MLEGTASAHSEFPVTTTVQTQQTTPFKNVLHKMLMLFIDIFNLKCFYDAEMT